jgi:prepilin-type N-terminal cleavage/methylation domain-containing protein
MKISNVLVCEKGFTLIELIVVFTVMAILSTIGVVSFVSYSRTQVINQVVSDLVQNLSMAKSLSASQLKTLDKNGSGPIGCLPEQSLNGYGIQIDQAQKYYALYMQCINSNGQKAPITTDPLWQTALPKNDVVFDSSLINATNVFFPVLSGGIITTGGNVIVLQSAYTGITQKTIHLSQGYISVTSP